MQYLQNFDIYNFEFWSGAKVWADRFAEQKIYNVLGDMILSAFEGTTPTATEINDYVWFNEELHAIVDPEESNL